MIYDEYKCVTHLHIEHDGENKCNLTINFHCDMEKQHANYNLNTFRFFKNTLCLFNYVLVKIEFIKIIRPQFVK